MRDAKEMQRIRSRHSSGSVSGTRWMKKSAHGQWETERLRKPSCTAQMTAPAGHGPEKDKIGSGKQERDERDERNESHGTERAAPPASRERRPPRAGDMFMGSLSQRISGACSVRAYQAERKHGRGRGTSGWRRMAADFDSSGRQRNKIQRAPHSGRR